MSRALLASLSLPTKIEFYSEYLNIVRFHGPDHLRRLTESLTAKYENVALDVVLAVRRKIEEELALERLELAHFSRTAQLGELSGSFAHELNQPLTSILANAGAGTRLLDKKAIGLGEIEEILEDIIADDKRASAVIAQLRQLMLKGEFKVDRLDLNEAVAATITLARSELVARQTKVDFRSEQMELPVMGNFAQLQQVILIWR